MKRKIYTYANIQMLEQCSFWPELKEYPQITVSKDLMNGMKRILSYPVRGIIDIKSMLDMVVPGWSEDVVKFYESITLTEFLRQKIDKASDTNGKNWLSACRKNINSIRSAIILLEEADIHPDDFPDTEDCVMNVFIEAWEYLISHDTSICRFRDQMKSLEKPEAVEELLMNSIGKVEKNTIVIHGFYYITPIQQRLLSVLEDAGYKLIYLFPYDLRYSFVNEIWNKTYAPEHGFCEKTEWIMQTLENKDPIGELFEGRKVSANTKLRIKEYASVYEFVEAMKHIREEGYLSYSADSSTANEILKDFYPEAYGERKLLSYPIGQFVATLNQMWDEELQEITISGDQLIECFSSGWLALDGISGRHYIKELLYILPYFEGCQTVGDWKGRIGQLKKLDHEVFSLFRGPYSNSEKEKRWQKLAENPFIQFSPFSIKEEDLEIITKLIIRLLDMATDLFGANEPIQLQDHIRKLEKILRQTEISRDLYKEEQALIEDLFAKLSDPEGFTATCFPSDISSALNLFMTGHFDDDELIPKASGMVSAIYRAADAEALDHRKIHVCFSDIDRMPGKEKQYVWPLTTSLINAIEARTKNPYIMQLKNIMESNRISNRYFMFRALHGHEVLITWIDNLFDKLMTPSPYIRLILRGTEQTVCLSAGKKITAEMVKNYSAGVGKTTTYDIERTLSDLVKEAKIDYAVCPSRYLYGYVVEEHPSYQTMFQQTYTLNSLISVIYGQVSEKYSPENVYKQVAELFPYVRNIEKHQVLDYVQKNTQAARIDGTTTCGDREYIDDRIRVLYPNEDVREKALAKYSELTSQKGRRGLDLYERTKIKYACMYCPHVNFCKNAIYPVDYKTEQEEYYDE